MSLSLSNHYQNVRLINMSSEPCGPFLVIQDAVDSNDSTQRERSWLLRKDGKWIDLIAHFTLDEKERSQAFFNSAQEVMTLLGKLPAKASIYEKQLSKQEVEAAAQRAMQLDVEEIRRLARQWTLNHSQ